MDAAEPQTQVWPGGSPEVCIAGLQRRTQLLTGEFLAQAQSRGLEERAQALQVRVEELAQAGAAGSAEGWEGVDREALDVHAAILRLEQKDARRHEYESVRMMVQSEEPKAVEALARLPEADRQWLDEGDGRRRRLAFDPDTMSWKVDEARAAEAAEQLQVLPGPVTRSTVAGRDFRDGAGTEWTFKGTRPGTHARPDDVVGPVLKEAGRDGRPTVADLRHLSPADRRLAADRIVQGLTDFDQHEEVRFVPAVAGVVSPRRRLGR